MPYTSSFRATVLLALALCCPPYFSIGRAALAVATSVVISGASDETCAISTHAPISRRGIIVLPLNAPSLSSPSSLSSTLAWPVLRLAVVRCWRVGRHKRVQMLRATTTPYENVTVQIGATLPFDTPSDRKARRTCAIVQIILRFPARPARLALRLTAGSSNAVACHASPLLIVVPGVTLSMRGWRRRGTPLRMPLVRFETSSRDSTATNSGAGASAGTGAEMSWRSELRLSLRVLLPSGAHLPSMALPEHVVTTVEQLPSSPSSSVSAGANSFAPHVLARATPRDNFVLVWRASGPQEPITVLLRVRAPSVVTHALRLLVHLPRVAPAVLRFVFDAVWPRCAPSAAGGDVIVAVLSAPLPRAAPARLVLLLPSANADGHSSELVIGIAPRELKQEDVPSLVAFRLPRVPAAAVGSPIAWRLEIADGPVVTIADDWTAGFMLRFAAPPILRLLRPAPMLAVPCTARSKLLTAHLPPEKRAVIGSPLSLMFGVTSEPRKGIAVTLLRPPLPPYRDREAWHHSRSTRLSFTNGGSGGAGSLVDSGHVTHSAFILEVRLLLSSSPIVSKALYGGTLLRNSSVVIPSNCRKQPSQAAVVVATLRPRIRDGRDNGNNMPLAFNFSLWDNRHGTPELRLFASGPSNIAIVPSAVLRVPSARPVIVLVSARLQDNYTVHNVVIISNGRHPNTLGLTITRSATTPDGDYFSLHVTHAPLEPCIGAQSTHVEIEWRINGIIAPLADVASVSESGPASLSSSPIRPVVTGLTDSLLVPVAAAPLNYNVSVRVLESNSSVVLLSGIAHGLVDRSLSPLEVLLNNGAHNLTFPVGMPSVRIYGNVSAQLNATDIMYTWSCAQGPSKKPCASDLLPEDIASSDNVTAFDVPTMELDIGEILTYSLSVTKPGHGVTSTSITILIEEADFVPLPTMAVRSFAGHFSGELVRNFEFECYQRLGFWTAESYIFEGEMDFRLIREGNDDVDVIRDVPGAILSKYGFWTPTNTTDSILGLDLMNIEEGQYILFGSGMGDARNRVSTTWRFFRKACAAVEVHGPPVLRGKAMTTTFYASATSSSEKNGAVFVFSVEIVSTTDPSSRHHAHLTSSPELRNGASNGNASMLPHMYVVQSHDGFAITSFTLPVAGNYSTSVQIYDVTGSKLLASARSADVISVAPSTTPFDNLYTVVDEERLVTAIAHNDERLFLWLLSEHGINSTLSPVVLAQAIDVLTSLSSARIAVVLTASHVVDACATLMGLDESRNLTRHQALRHIVEHVISFSLATATSNELIRRPLERFYSLANEALATAIHDRLSAHSDDELRNAAVQLRQSAVYTIAAALTTGHECGSVDRLTVPFITSDGQEVIDEYRVGVECFEGQQQSLSPTPVLYSMCNSSDAEQSVPSIVEFVMAYEQVDITKLTAPTDDQIVHSPIVGTRFVTRHVENGLLQIIPIDRRDECHWTQIIVEGADLVFERQQGTDDESTLMCYGAGVVESRNELASTEETDSTLTEELIDEFFVSDNGTVETWARRTTRGAVQLSVNVTTLRKCRLANLSGTASASRKITIIIVTVTVAVGLLAIMVLVVLGRRRYLGAGRTMPSSAAAWDTHADSMTLTGSSGSLTQRHNEGVLAWDTTFSAEESGGNGALAASGPTRRDAQTSYPYISYQFIAGASFSDQQSLSSVGEYVPSEDESAPPSDRSYESPFLRDEFGRGLGLQNVMR